MVLDLEDMLDIEISSLNLSKKDNLYIIVQAIKKKLNMDDASE